MDIKAIREQLLPGAMNRLREIDHQNIPNGREDKEAHAQLHRLGLIVAMPEGVGSKGEKLMLTPLGRRILDEG